ncbi:MAG: hypothetical protein AB7E26_14470 [Chryseobacterium sp.]
MSDAMVKYHHEYKGTEDLSKYWAKYIYEQCKNNKTFWFTEDEIAGAFLESVKRQTKLISNVSALDIENFIKKITESISDSFRKDERFSREQWDPTLKSDEYLFAEPEKAINYFIQKCDSLKKTLKKVKDQLEILKSFTILGKEVKIQTLDDIIKGIDEQIKSIEDLSNWLIENRNDIKLKIPFLCGVWNGLVEFVAGFLDIALLAINITVSDLAGGETNLEFLEIREGVEEALGAVLKDPSKVFKDAIEGIKNYKYARYDDPKLNEYQIQHNEGEDLILTIDIIVTIVTIIKGIAKLAQLLSNFTKWIDEVLELRQSRKLFRNLERVEKAWQSGWTKEKVLAKPKGERPSPVQCFVPEHVIEHYNLFQKEGTASRVISKQDFEDYGIGKPDLGKTEFVSRKSDIDDILMLSVEEQAVKLGKPIEQIKKGELVRIDFDLSKKDVKIEIPSGNEWGANSQWIPGGVLPDGNLEAIIRTEGLIENAHYTVKYLKK